MSLSINTNTTALTAHRFMAANNASMAKSIERLSSGLRINSAADDPAGLVISQQLDTQVQGLDQATKNTTNAVNMIKTGDAALNEVETQLQNIRNLTLDASNGTATAATKQADQAQVAQAMSTIDGIANQTQFAGRYLLGTDAGGNNLNNTIFQIGANNGETATFAVGANASDMHANTANGLNLNTGVSSFATATQAFTAMGTATDSQALSIKYTRANGTVDSYNVTLTNAANTGDTQAHAVAAINAALVAQRPADNSAPKLVASASGGNIVITLDPATATTEQSAAANITFTQTAVNGANGFTGLTTNVGAVSNGVSGAIDLTTSTTGVLAKVDAALTKVNNLRVNLGAFQSNTLQSKLNSLSVASENTAASESSIRDTDMAKEMVNFTKEQILTQAAQAMLTQANTAPQNILTMLRG